MKLKKNNNKNRVSFVFFPSLHRDFDRLESGGTNATKKNKNKNQRKTRSLEWIHLALNSFFLKSFSFRFHLRLRWVSSNVMMMTIHFAIRFFFLLLLFFLLALFNVSGDRGGKKGFTLIFWKYFLGRFYDAILFVWFLFCLFRPFARSFGSAWAAVRPNVRWRCACTSAGSCRPAMRKKNSVKLGKSR